MTDPQQADPAQVRYRVKGAVDPGDAHGWFDLTVRAEGGVTLRHKRRGLDRTWAARIDATVWRRLLAALNASTQAEIPEGRELEPTGTPGRAALRILDTLLHQVSGGVIPGAGTLPLIVHGVAETGRTAPVPTTPVAAVGELSPRRVAGVVKGDGGVSVIAVPVGTPVTGLPPTGSAPTAIAFGDVGTGHRPRPVVLTGGDDGVIRLWTAAGDPMAQQVRHAAPISAVTTSVDKQKLQVWSADLGGRMFQRSLIPGVMVLGWPPVPGPPAGITALGWAGTAAYQVIVLGLDDGRVVRRAVMAPDDVQTWKSHDGPVRAIALIGADDDFLIASAGADGDIRLRSGRSGTARPGLPGHDAGVTGLSFGLIGDRLVLGSCALDGTVCTWDVDAGEPLARWSAGDDWPVGVADARTGTAQRWATGGADGVVRVWDAATGEQVHELSAGGAAVMCVTTAMLPGLTVVAAGYQDGAFRMWNAADGSVIGVDRSSSEPLTSIEFGGDGTLVAFVCGTLSGSVRVYDPTTCTLVKVLTPHTDRVTALAFGFTKPAGEPVIVSGGADRSVRIWDGRNGWPKHCLDGHTDEVTAVALGEVEGRAVVASSGYDGTLRLWDVGSGTPLGQAAISKLPVHALAFGTVSGSAAGGAGGGGAGGAAGGRTVIGTGGQDDAVRVLDVETAELLMATAAVPGRVVGMVVGAWRGVEVVAVAVGDAVSCWKIATGDPVPVTRPGSPPVALTFDAGGELLAIGADGVIDRLAPDERE